MEGYDVCMNLRLQRNDRGALRGNDKRSFRVVMINEDALASRQAQEFCSRLMDEFGGNRTLKEKLWNFNVLGIRKIRNVAVSAAGAADIVIVSASGKRELPADTKDWLELWAWLIEGGHCTLIGLFGDENAEQAASIRTYLGSIAKRKHLAFFPRTTLSRLRAFPLPPPPHKTEAGFSDADEGEPGEVGTTETELTAGSAALGHEVMA